MKKELINDSELENVSGGMKGYEVTEMRYDFDAGDTFHADGLVTHYVVYYPASRLSLDDMIYCKVYTYIDARGKYSFVQNQSIYVSALINSSEYLGNGIINSSNIEENKGPAFVV